MNETRQTTGLSASPDLEAIFAISQAVAGTEDPEIALDEVAQLARDLLIFDNLVLYQANQQGALDPSFARAIGRGRFREADLAWGESVAQQAFDGREPVTRIEVVAGEKDDRTNTRHLLALPVYSNGQIAGALVFIRFGGPSFTPEQVKLAGLIAAHINQLVGRNALLTKISILEAGRRLDALQEDFIATITHELLTPLGFIKGYATTLLRADADWDISTRHEFLTYIDEEADKLRELIDNMLDSSQLQTGTLPMNFQPIRLEMLVKEVSQRTCTQIDNLQVEVEIESPGLQVSADPVRLAQVIVNILNNAAKYAAGAPVTIRVDRQDTWARIAIRDRGPGIPPEHQDKIFQRFYRIPNQNTTTRGSGLGLYICRNIIQAHHGELTVESQPGEGTTFSIFLPYQ